METLDVWTPNQYQRIPVTALEGETGELIVASIPVAMPVVDQDGEKGLAGVQVISIQQEGGESSRLWQGVSFLAGTALGNRYVESGASLLPNLLARAHMMRIFWKDAMPEIHSTFLDSIISGMSCGADYVEAHINGMCDPDRAYIMSPAGNPSENFSLTKLGRMAMIAAPNNEVSHAPYYDMAGIGAEMAVNGSVATLGLLAIRNKYKSLGASLIGFSLASHVTSWAQFYFRSIPDFSGEYRLEWYWDFGGYDLQVMSGVGVPYTLVKFMMNFLPISRTTAVNALFFGHLLAPIAAVAMLARIIVPKEEVEGEQEVELTLQDKLRIAGGVATSLAQTILRTYYLDARDLTVAFKLLSSVSLISQGISCYQDFSQTCEDLQSGEVSTARKGLSVAKSALSVAMFISYTSLLCIQGPLVSIILSSGLAHMAIQRADAYLLAREEQEEA